MKDAWSLFGWMLLVVVTAGAILGAVVVVRDVMNPEPYVPTSVPPTTVVVEDLPFVEVTGVTVGVTVVTTVPVTTVRVTTTVVGNGNGIVVPPRPQQASSVLVPVPQLGL